MFGLSHPFIHLELTGHTNILSNRSLLYPVLMEQLFLTLNTHGNYLKGDFSDIIPYGKLKNVHKFENLGQSDIVISVLGIPQAICINNLRGFSGLQPIYQSLFSTWSYFQNLTHQSNKEHLAVNFTSCCCLHRQLCDDQGCFLQIEIRTDFTNHLRVTCDLWK